MTIHHRWLFIFRQDLRLVDNTALLQAYTSCEEVIPLFIFDTNVLDRFHKPDARLGFLLEVLQSVQKELRSKWSDLFVAYGNSSDLIPQLCKQRTIDALFWNRSYGRGSHTRDGSIKERAQNYGTTVYESQDYLLVEPEQVATRKVFTPFYHLWQQVPKSIIPCNSIDSITPLVAIPQSNSVPLLDISDIQHCLTVLWWNIQQYRNKSHFLEKREQLDSTHYDDRRNRPDQEATSMLSPYLRFWVVSPRQILTKILDKNTTWTLRQTDWTVTMDKKVFNNSFVSELAWREFRRHIDHHFPETRMVEFQEKRRHIQRQNNSERFTARKEGKTGYPIVDAAMRQLNTTNRMHGRCRMIVASFLCKDLLIDRQLGEQYFANLLIDYDEAVNRGNRQRSASVWADPKPLRIFNPILQSQKFDPEAHYIKKWIPELARHSAEALHDPLTHTLDRYKPIVNHYETSKLAKDLYKGAAIQASLF